MDSLATLEPFALPWIPVTVSRSPHLDNALKIEESLVEDFHAVLDPETNYEVSTWDVVINHGIYGILLYTHYNLEIYGKQSFYGIYVGIMKVVKFYVFFLWIECYSEWHSIWFTATVNGIQKWLNSVNYECLWWI